MILKLASPSGPLLICSGAASRRDCRMGVQLGFYGGSTRWRGHRGRFAGAAAAVRELPGSSARLSRASLMLKRRAATAAVPALRAA